MLWLRGRRPSEPPDWRSVVHDAEDCVGRSTRGQPLAAGEVPFDPLWTAHKTTFSRAQHGKCGYCEMFIAADPDGGDIEHYRPKAQITELLDDPETWGAEVTGHNSRDPARPRHAPIVCERGYWWLAYDWENYLLACGTCNEKWKGNLFPIRGERRRAPTKKSCAGEDALLLNPYGEIDPLEHLEFDKIGLITPRQDSKWGRETIRTCHLGRESLRRSRHPVASDAWTRISRVLIELAREPINELRLRRAVGRLLALGGSTKQHAGMVRGLWAQREPYHLTWDLLRKLHKALKIKPGA